MTVAALPSAISYLENGVTLSFAVPFRFLPGAIGVTRVLTDGSVVGLTAGVDFSLTGGGTDEGGELIIASSVAGARLRIKRKTPRNQGTDYTTGDRFPAESHENALDRAMMIDQEQDDRIADTTSRALMVPDGEVAGVFPDKDARAGRFIVGLVGGGFGASAGTGVDTGLREDLADGPGTDIVSHKSDAPGAKTGRSARQAIDDHVILNRFLDMDEPMAGLTNRLRLQQLLTHYPKRKFSYYGQLYLDTSVASVDIPSGASILADTVSSYIRPVTATGDVFTAGDGIADVSQVALEFSLWPTVTRTSGWILRARHFTEALLNINVGLDSDFNRDGNRIRNGIWLDGFASVKGVMHVWAAAKGIQINGKLDGAGNQILGAEFSLLRGSRIAGTSDYGLRLGGACGGVHTYNDFSFCGGGVVCDETLTPAPNRELFLDPGTTLDTLGGPAVDVVSLALLEANAPWIAACGKAGASPQAAVIARPGCGVNAKWIGVRGYRNAYDFAELNDGAHSFVGGYISESGTSGPGPRKAAHGIVGNAFSSLVVGDVTIDNNGDATRGRPIWLQSGTNFYTISSNRFFSNGEADTVRAPDMPGPTRVIRGNSGHITENSGFATIPNGQAFVDVAHGLADTPTYASADWASAPQVGAELYCAPGEFTSTTIRIRLSGVATADRAVSFRATRGQA